MQNYDQISGLEQDISSYQRTIMTTLWVFVSQVVDVRSAGRMKEGQDVPTRPAPLLGTSNLESGTFALINLCEIINVTSGNGK